MRAFRPTIASLLLGATILAACDVTEPVDDRSKGPQPRSGDRVLLDTRAGGAQSIQKGGTDEETALGFMHEVWRGVSFIDDFDGRGTAAYRHTFAGQPLAISRDRCTDVSATSIYYFRDPLPRELYVSWTMQMGRTKHDPEGIGEVGHFDITSDDPVCGPSDGAGRKIMRFLRDVPSGGSEWSFDLLWGGPSPDAHPFFCCFDEVDRQEVRIDMAYHPEEFYNRPLTMAIHLKTSTTPTARDGVLRHWVDGKLVLERTNLPLGTTAVHRFQWPMIVRHPAADMTEYWWDIVAWEPR